MAKVLDGLLKDSILIDDFKLWLICDSAENCREKSDFIPYFLNYVKDKCAWLTSKEAKCFDPPAVKLKLEDNQSPDTNFRSVSSNQKGPKYSTDNNNRNLSSERNENSFTGVKSSRPLKVNEEIRNKGQPSRAEFFTAQPKIIGNEKKSPKSHFIAKKSLNFHSIDETKANVNNSKHVRGFEENIKSFDAFPPLDQKSNNGKSRNPKVSRRITPTPVQAVNKGSSKFGASVFASPTENVSNDAFRRTPFIENHTSNLQTEREMLKMTRNNFTQSAVPSNVNDLKVEIVSPKKSTPVQYIIPDPKKVSHQKQLEMFSSIYDILITYALVPNLTSEMYFIFELLTSKTVAEVKCKGKNNIFCSVHNCTFFGIAVLEKLQSFLKLLDKNTLFSLCEIPFLPEFSSELVNVLQNCCEEKQENFTRPQTLTRVPFLLEEDSKENFIDSHAFTSFRKQRDLFYELLRDWQQQSLDSVDAKFQEKFSRKARLLINLAPNAVNLNHLAKLFQNQMIASCLGLEVNEVYDDLLSDIQRNFPGKFEKLRQRFMMPFCVGEPNPRPTFYGIQSFYSELVLAASSATLNQQLQDIFVCKILEFDSTDIFSDEELSSLGSVKEKYVFLLHTLRLLGKFLGFLHFLPYKVSETLPLSIVNYQLNSRKHSVPPLDVLKLLRTAVENNRVILTVPWIVEFLSMIDPVAKNLSYIQESLNILVAIYRGNYILSSNSLNFWFLRLIIGWLFDVLSYPFEYYTLLQPISFEKNVKCEGLDFLAIIDKQLVHSCCPYLIEFKVLVHSFLNGIKNKNKRDIRKITPLSTTKPCVSTSLSIQQIESQLEENFFFLHPPSLKKTVDFVSDRVASKVISRIRSEVTEFKLDSIKHITTQEAYKSLQNSIPPNEAKLKSFIDSCILKLYEKSYSRISDFINLKCREDIDQIMPCVLSNDIKPPVVKVCCDISFRCAIDKITDWCDTNLSLLDIQKDIKNKLNHLSKGEGDTITDKDLTVSSLIHSLRQLTIKAQSLSRNINNDHIKVLSEIPPYLEKEIGTSTKKLIVFLTIDLYIAFVIFSPEICDDNCNKAFSDIWSQCKKRYDLETYYLGVQNIKFLLTGKNLELSCEKYTVMLSGLIDNHIFDPVKLKTYFIKLNCIQWKDSRSLRIFGLISDILK